MDVRNLEVGFPVRSGIFLRQTGEVRAVDKVSFSVRRGETLGLVGESGCGKSTTGRAIINLIRHTAPQARLDGEVRYDGRQILDLPRGELMPYRAKIQMIFQDPYSSLNPRMTVGRMVEDPMALHLDLSKKERRERMLSLLARVGLSEDQSGRYPHEFSGGQRQRVGIARALATRPELVIADEPVSALDVSIQAQVLNLMMELQREFGLTYLFIAHNLGVVEHISDRIAVMYLGKIVEVGPSREVYHRPRHPYTQALLSAVPRMDPLKKSQRQVLSGDVPSPLHKPSGCPFRTRCPMAKPDCAKQEQVLVEVAPGHSLACQEITGKVTATV
ncbi:MAG: ABC transporter ATP-binding protein [Planctomycetota bacterium]